MNNEYYGSPTTPTSDFLAHYGVKGMHWGVRKAIERGSEKALDRQYKKAQKKLSELKDRTNIKKQIKIHNTAKAAGIASAMASPASVIAGHMIGKKTIEKTIENVPKIYNTAKGVVKNGTARRIHYTTMDARIPGYIAGAASLGSAIGNAYVAHRAKKRVLPEGHAKAVKDVKNWQSEMNKAFKGTKYDTSRRRKRK